MENEKLPQLLVEKINMLCLQQTELIDRNLRKGRYVFRCVYRDKKAIVKWNELDNGFCERLRKEIRIYRYLNRPPALLYADENTLVIEDLGECITVREYLLSEQGSVLKATEALLQAYEVFYDSVQAASNHEPDASVWSEASGRLNVLYCSGPVNTTMSKGKYDRNRILFLLHGLKCCFYLQFCNCRGAGNTIHGDLHLNNIITDGDGFYLIDLENVHRGYPEIELAFLYAQLVKLSQCKKEKIKCKDLFLECAHRNRMNPRFMSFFMKNYESAIQWNERFGR